MNNRIPALLSVNGGFVDTASFLSLHGLFAAHVTGNFVTLGASLALGTSGGVAKTLALPVFCLTIVGARFLHYLPWPENFPVPRVMLSLIVLLLTIGAVLAIELGPFADGDSFSAIMTGMVFVSAMAIQNAAQRVHMAKSPPSTMMTGTTTQIMIDIADLIHDSTPETKAAARTRLPQAATAVLAFAIGCGSAALLFSLTDAWCFVVPPVIALLVLLDLFSHENRRL